MEGANSVASRGLDWIGDAKQSCDLSVDRHEHDRLSLAAQFLSPVPKGCRVNAEPLEMAKVADCHAPPVDDAGHALPGHRLEVVDRRQREVLFTSAGHDSRRQGMLADVFEARSQAQQRGRGRDC